MLADSSRDLASGAAGGLHNLANAASSLPVAAADAASPAQSESGASAADKSIAGGPALHPLTLQRHDSDYESPTGRPAAAASVTRFRSQSQLRKYALLDAHEDPEPILQQLPEAPLPHTRTIAPQLRVCCTRSCSAIREFALFPITFDSIDSRQMTDTAAADHAVPVRLRRLSIGPDDDARARARGATSMIAVRSQAHVPRQALSGAPCPVSCRLECRVNRPARTRSRSVDGGGRAGLAGDCTRHATAVVK